ncbi:3-carboxy-cis,cis-muconate cycloisomerase [Streptomyces sp. NPDC049837]|uniref:3-carboxy-cis,cis-muconate cycloisomerase n=1 Tax=Streptomyces sp. NPDC049837 TaxID=3155277 RepID=UPI003424DE25
MTYDDGLLAPGSAGTPAEAATSDAAFLRAMLDAEAALARVQAPPEAAGAITAACAGEFGVRDLALRARAGGNPVIPLVDGLAAAVPEYARPYVHRGATSQDILDTAAMLVATRALAPVLADLERTAVALRALAAGHRDTVMPGRTLTQHAVPTTFGLKAAGWRALVLDARDRVAAVRDRLPAQLGGAAGTLAAFEAYGCDDAPALVAAYAREVGLAEPALPWHTLRTPVADLAGSLAFTAGALGKVAADVLSLSRTEVGEVVEGSGGGSSAMPHKANPVRATLIAAAARRAPAHAAVLYGSVAAGDERPAGAWHAEWEPLRDLLRLVGGAAHHAARLAEGLRVHPERMRANLALTDGLIVSERLRARFRKDRLTRAAEEVRTTGRSLADVLGVPPELTDPAHYTGAAAQLTDRALERR